PFEIAGDALSDPGQDLAECDHAFVLRLIAHGAPVGMVTILFAVSGIAAGGLDVAVVVGADPNVGPGRRNGEAADAAERALVPDYPAVGSAVAETVLHRFASNAGPVVAHVAQSGGAGGGFRI